MYPRFRTRTGSVCAPCTPASTSRLKHLLLQPGEALKKHVASVDVYLYVLAGHGIVEVGDERQEVDVDTLVEIPAQAPHRLLNEGDAPFRVLNVKSPRPTIPTKVVK